METAWKRVLDMLKQARKELHWFVCVMWYVLARLQERVEGKEID